MKLEPTQRIIDITENNARDMQNQVSRSLQNNRNNRFKKVEEYKYAIYYILAHIFSTYYTYMQILKRSNMYVLACSCSVTHFLKA